MAKLGLIAKTQHLFDMQTARLLYITLLLPVMDYCSSVFMVAAKGELVIITEHGTTDCTKGGHEDPSL